MLEGRVVGADGIRPLPAASLVKFVQVHAVPIEYDMRPYPIH